MLFNFVLLNFNCFRFCFLLIVLSIVHLDCASLFLKCIFAFLVLLLNLGRLNHY